MADLISTTRKQAENSNSLHRRFMKHFKTSGIIQYTRKNRTYERPLSKNVRRNERIKQIVKQEKFQKEYRLGKISPFHKKK